MSAEPERLRVELGARAYDILLGTDLLAEAARHLAPLLTRPRRLVVVSDERVAPLHAARLLDGLARAGHRADLVTVPAGEGSKSWGGLAALTDRMQALPIDRRTLVLALGGGVVGDLAGFAAAIAMRGIDFVQIPTTLLAQVDSSVGGKTGINTAAGKNMIGAFHQPRLVLADMALLDTLPARELRSGYAEVIKHAVIADAPFFGWLEANGAALLAGDRAARLRAVRHSCETKAGIVTADEREGGARALLNLGHTFGHALEAETGFSDRLLHGEAVALGMSLAMDLSVRLLGCPPADAERLRRHLKASGLPSGLADLPGPMPGADALLGHMAHDKKTTDGRLTFILADRLGAARIVEDVPPDAVRSLLEQARQAA